MNEISVFPNPFYLNGENFAKGIRSFKFARMPDEAIIRIYSLSGSLIKKIVKSDLTAFAEWDLTDLNNHLVTAGIYLAYIEMPGIGEKIMKLVLVY